MQPFSPVLRAQAHARSAVIVFVIASALLLAACNKQSDNSTFANTPASPDAQAAARKLVEGVLADYAAAGDTDPIGFLSRRTDVDTTVVSTMQHDMSLDPRDPLLCGAGTAADFRFVEVKTISQTRLLVEMQNKANRHIDYTVELGPAGKWLLASVDCQ